MEREELLAAVGARLERIGDRQDLSPLAEPEAVTEVQRLAAALTGDGDDLQDAVEQASSVAGVLLLPVIGSMDPALLSAVVSLCQCIIDATPDSHSDRAARLGNLGAALGGRSMRTGLPGDLDAAIEAFRAAADAVPAGHSGRPP